MEIEELLLLGVGLGVGYLVIQNKQKITDTIVASGGGFGGFPISPELFYQLPTKVPAEVKKKAEELPKVVNVTNLSLRDNKLIKDFESIVREQNKRLGDYGKRLSSYRKELEDYKRRLSTLKDDLVSKTRRVTKKYKPHELTETMTKQIDELQKH
ncbi:MAG: hypothetical protein ACTSWZ_00700, partial [Candidatus Heimdallarchaeaceae archaeon]